MFFEPMTLNTSPVIYASVLAGALLVLVALRPLLMARRKPLPPGPPTLPFIGNAHLLRNTDADKVFRDWHSLYGPIIRVKLGTQTIISIGSYDVARALLDKKGSIYSSRPRMVMAGELATRGSHSATLPYGPQWKLHNRLHQSLLNPRATRRYRPLLNLESLQLMKDLSGPLKLEKCFHRYAASILISLTDGRRVERQDDEVMWETWRISQRFINLFAVGNSIIDLFPVLKYLPAPLSPWKQKANKFYERTIDFFQSRAASALNSKSWNWTKHTATFKDTASLRMEERLYALGVLYEAGVDTATEVLRVVILAAAANPEAARKVQAEIDLITGRERVPNFDDLPSVPYFNAFLNECLRWWNIAPQGIPHSVMEDDEYMGFHIPRKSTVIASYLVINDDESLFPESSVFRPERWLENENLPVTAFGFGRRACVGRHLGWDMLAVAAARLLWLYDAGNIHRDGQKGLNNVWDHVRNGAQRVPAPFSASFKPRDPWRLEVLEKTLASSDKSIGSILDLAEA